MRSSNWINVWNNISGKVPSRKKITLSKMIKLNAFGTTKGGLSSKYWLSYVNNILKLSKINKGDKVLEVGCGAGAFLYPFYKKGIKCFGVDYSKNLISVCKRAIKNGIFLTNRANNLRKFKNAYFDLVISNSVFQYFDNYHYSEKVIKEMIRVIKKNKKIFILDIPDLKKKSHYEKFVIKNLGKEKFVNMYTKTKHLYYDKNFFKKISKKLNLKIKIKDQKVKNYINAPYRYNVYITKN